MKTADEIILEIQSQVVFMFSVEQQVKFLQEKKLEYAAHPDIKMIEKACDILIGAYMPKDENEDLIGRLNQELNFTNFELDLARRLFLSGKYKEALDISMSLSQMADERPVTEDDGESVYCFFREEFEKILYLEVEKQNGCSTADRLKETPFPYYEIYAMSGLCLKEAGMIPEASEEFKKALHWNPGSADIISQYVITLFGMGETMNTWSLLLDNMKYAFRRSVIADCYSHFWYYYMAGGDEEAAVACLFLSTQYVHSEDRENYLKAMMKEMSLLPSFFTEEKLTELAEKYQFPLNPEKKVIKLAYEKGIAVIDEDPKSAVYFLRIARDLAPDDQVIKEKLAMAEKKLEG